MLAIRLALQTNYGGLTMKHTKKHTKLYDYTKAYADTNGVDIFDVAEFKLYTKHGKYVNTVTFKKMCKMIVNNCVFMSKSKHIPIVGYYPYRDYRLVEQYENTGFTVYCLDNKNYNLFSELYFDYQ